MKTNCLTLVLLSATIKLMAQSLLISYNYPFTWVEIDSSHHYLESKAAVSTILGLNNNHTIYEVDIDVDEIFGMTDQHFEHYYKGVKIDRVRTTTHQENGRQTHLTSNYSPISDEYVVTPSITESQALELAISYSGHNNFLWDEDANVTVPVGELTLVTFVGDIDTLLLAYKYDFSVDSTLHENNIIYVDANNGGLVKVNDYKKSAGSLPALDLQMSYAQTRDFGLQRIKTNLVSNIYRTEYDQGALFNATSMNFYTSSSSFNSTDEVVQGGYQAYWLSQWMSGFLSSSPFKIRSGWNNNNGLIVIYNHTSQVVSHPIKVESTYGANIMNIYYGTQNSNYEPTVVAHEVFHGVQGNLRNWQFPDENSESESLEEANADIFGVIFGRYMKETFGLNDYDYWEICRGWPGFERHLDVPKSTGYFASTYQGDNWSETLTANSSYWNSTVVSHWFYLLANGGEGTNDKGKEYLVSKISWDKAALIWWKAVKYAKVDVRYMDFAKYTKNAAKKKYGKESNEYYQTMNAWYAVNMRSKPPQAPVNLEVKADGSISPRRLLSADMVGGLSGAFEKRIKVSWAASTAQDDKAISQYWIIDNGEILGSTAEKTYVVNTFDSRHEFMIIAEDSDGELSDPAEVIVENVYKMDSNEGSYVGPLAASVSVLATLAGAVTVTKLKRINELKTKKNNDQITPTEEEELQSLLNDKSSKCE